MEDRRSRGDVTRAVDASVARALAKAHKGHDGPPISHHHKKANKGRKFLGACLLGAFTLIILAQAFSLVPPMTGTYQFGGVALLAFFGGLLYVPESMDTAISLVVAIRGKQAIAQSKEKENGD